MIKNIQFLGLFLALILLSSCSSSDNEEKTIIDKHNDKVAEKVIEAIEKPMAKVQGALDKLDARAKEMEDRSN